MPSIRAAEYADAERMAPNLRSADLAELKATTSLSPLEALCFSVRMSLGSWTILDDNDEPFAMYGVGDDQETEWGVPWMLGTEGIARNWRWFLRNTKRIVQDMHQDYPVIANAADRRNVVHLRWIEWAGFTLIPDPINGPSGHSFIQFYKEKPPCVSWEQAQSSLPERRF